MDERYKIEQTSELICKHFSLDSSEFKTENTSFEFIINRLTNIISYLLEKDYKRLINGLYRIDVDENKVKKIFEEHASNNIAEHIAQLIIERELQKVETRIKFSKKR